MAARRVGRRMSAGALGAVLAAAGVLSLAAGAFAVQVLTVIQDSTAIRKEKKVLGAKVATVKEGDQLSALDEDDTWYKVEFNGMQGYILKSSVSTTAKKDLVLSEQVAQEGGVKATEQSAAKRGFDEATEKAHLAQRPDLKTIKPMVDEIESKKYPEHDIARFMADGKLGDAAVTAADAAAGHDDARAEAPATRLASPPWRR